MYPSQPVTPEGRRPATTRSLPDPARSTKVTPPARTTRTATGGQSRPAAAGQSRTPASGSQAPGPHNAVASFVTYVKALEDIDRRAFPDEFARHADRIKELKPFLKAHGILDVMTIKNPEIAALVGI